MSACCQTAAFSPQIDEKDVIREPLPWLKLGTAILLAGLSMQLSLGINISHVEEDARILIHSVLIGAALLVLALLGLPLFRRSWHALLDKRLTLEQLFILGIFGSFGTSLHSTISGTGPVYYEVIGVLVSIYTLGQLLVARQRQKVRGSLNELIDSLHQATILTCCGKEKRVPVSSLEVGDKIKVFKGQRLPVDGMIMGGAAFVQQINHTGEPFPASKTVGDTVLAGTLSLDGDLIIQISEAHHSRQLDQISQRLEAAMRRPSAWQRQADRWMGWFVPSIGCISLLTFLFWLYRSTWETALFNSLAVLLVACPCGLGLGVPLALWHSMQRLAGLGIWVDQSDLIEKLATIKTVVFDKTGTLTEGDLKLTQLVVLDGMDVLTLRSQLAWIQAHCDHPVSKPFSEFIQFSPYKAADIQISLLPGIGIRTEIRNTGEKTIKLTVGNEKLLLPEHRASLQKLEALVGEGQSNSRKLYVFQEDQLVSMAILKEVIHPALGSVADQLTLRGLRTEIMSGDTTSLDPGAFPHPVKLSTGMTSAEKAQAVVDLQKNGQNVLFIGDGLNDAEAISVSTVGLAVSKGDATARIHADGEISMASFKLLPQAVDVARKTLRTVRMILGISLCYNFVGIALACGGVLHPVAAACIMVVSSMTVIAVAARKC